LRSQIRSRPAPQFNGAPAQPADFRQRVATVRAWWDLARHTQNIEDARFERGGVFERIRFGCCVHRDLVGHQRSGIRTERQLCSADAQTVRQAPERKGLQQSKHISPISDSVSEGKVRFNSGADMTTLQPPNGDLGQMQQVAVQFRHNLRRPAEADFVAPADSTERRRLRAVAGPVSPLRQ
jgi:hypothetical protein